MLQLGQVRVGLRKSRDKYEKLEYCRVGLSDSPGRVPEIHDHPHVAAPHPSVSA